MLLCLCSQTSSRRQSIDEGNKLEVPLVKKVSAEKLEAMDQQQRRASMQGRRLSLVEVIPDWPSLKTPEKQVEVQTHTSYKGEKKKNINMLHIW